jgi:beta-ribofuranosylaminobenzene 5'-phosphate synthase
MLSQILPGVAEARLDVFSSGVNAIQTNVWKSQEIALHGPKMAQLMNTIRDFGASAVGMSSFGPTLYALGDNLSLVKDQLESTQHSEIESCTLTKPNNTGITFKEI